MDPRNKTSHRMADVARPLARAARLIADVQACAQEAAEHADLLSGEERALVGAEVAQLAQLADELGVRLATLAAVAEAQAFQLARAEQRAELPTNEGEG